MEDLKRKRERIKSKLVRITAFTDNIDVNVASEAEVHIRLDIMAEVWSEFDEVQTQIECACLENELSTQQAEQEKFETKFLKTKTKLMQLTESITNRNMNLGKKNSSPLNTNSQSLSQIRLPKIELPTFTGSYQQWTSFSDIFTSVIHNNMSLSPVQKLHYLKAAVQGDAARLLNSVAITDANYVEAWNILKNRFSNKRQIIQSHLKSLHAQPKLTRESPKDIRQLLDITIENLRALNAIGLPTQHWDHLIAFQITEKLDASSRRHWELAVGDQENPTFNDLQQFLERRCRALEAANTETKPQSTIKQTGTQSGKRPQATMVYHTTQISCIKCKANHPLYKCEGFIQLPIQERIELVKKSTLCLNCLRSGHLRKNCKSSACKQCNRYHNTLLHKEAETCLNPISIEKTLVTTHHARKTVNINQVLLATAMLRVRDRTGQFQTVRALLDSGSQATFITEACVQRLGLERGNSHMMISGLASSTVGQSRGIVQLTVTSIHSEMTYSTKAFILSRITETMPLAPINSDALIHIVKEHNLQLADPQFNKPAHIDLLVGADLYYDVLLAGKIKDKTSNLTLQNTAIGWIIAGAMNNIERNALKSYLVVEDVSRLLQRFWEIEELPTSHTFSLEEMESESIFQKTYTRSPQGRFIVELPFNSEVQHIGDTKQMAKQRLLQIERKLEKNPLHKQAYQQFMKEYLDMDHMEKVESCFESKCSYHLPHHYVLRDESTTTKLRVVFDGSARPLEGLALNQTLLVGPTIQEDLVTILTRFRIHNIVFTADISKMYRQVLVNKKHHNYQRILWRTDSTHPIEEFTLKTVTYGTAAAPFLAVRCLMELATIGREQYPLASQILKRDFYVDDVMSGSDCIDLAQQAQAQLIALLGSAGFELHKWRSNSTKLLAQSSTTHIIKDNQEVETKATKILGIYWHPEGDYLSFQVAELDPRVVTKRSILSQTSKLFDPLGWIAPVIMTAKLIMQQLWLSGIGWDEQPASDMVERWIHYTSTLKNVSKIKIPRQMVRDSTSRNWQLHGFSDSSEQAYGAVIYIRSLDHSELHARLVCSKSRVAPLKRLSIPRLELCGALLLARLLSVVSSILEIHINDIVAWTDSAVVLAWLNKHPHHWKPFIANRVTQIQELVPPEHWKHVRSRDNPADCLTRGLPPNDIQHHSLWWNGPPWLSLPEVDWPTQELLPTHQEEARAVTSKESTSLMVSKLEPALPERMSSWSRLVRITAYCFRFGKNCQLKFGTRTGGWLTLAEHSHAELFWIQKIQQEFFQKEIQGCKRSQSGLLHSPLRQLNPFVDAQGTLRVGGRIDNAPVPYDHKHPIILPGNHRVTQLIVEQYHKLYLHAGPQLLLAVLRTKFWITKAKQLIRKLIHNCVRCFKFKVITSQQLMGSLPKHRLEPARPFIRSGIDYAGPICIKAHHGRGKIKVFKAYICIIVCFATKAVHLELAGDLTTQSFLGALRRFCSRRGKPSDIYTDCGTNFVGASRELRELQMLITSKAHNEKIASALTQHGIDWHFNPPAAPHFGGLWEAGVKSTKFHLRRTIGLTKLTYEELNTLLTQIEACLNSRPICPLSSDTNDLDPLTPGHFLIGESLTAVPDRDYANFKLHQLNRWQLIQQKLQHFWKRWTIEYLSRLQQRPKWCTPQPNLKIGDLIIVKGDATSPLQWPMARVIQTHPGTDELVRTVTLQTVNGIIKRPISKCCLLPITDNCN